MFAGVDVHEGIGVGFPSGPVMTGIGIGIIDRNPELLKPGEDTNDGADCAEV